MPAARVAAEPETTWRRPVFARVYRRAAVRADDRGAVDHRRALVAGLSGRVVELGVGPGLNFRHYPAAAQLTAVEPETSLRAEARAEARRALARITVVAGTAERLPLADRSCDAAVLSLLLCSLADPSSALTELRRVLRPGGRLRFYEHVVSSEPRVARLQRLVDRGWPRIAAGCHTARDSVAAIQQAGFEVRSCRRLAFRPSALLPAVPYVIGEATADRQVVHRRGDPAPAPGILDGCPT